MGFHAARNSYAARERYPTDERSRQGDATLPSLPDRLRQKDIAAPTRLASVQ